MKQIGSFLYVFLVSANKELLTFKAMFSKLTNLRVPP